MQIFLLKNYFESFMIGFVIKVLSNTKHMTLLEDIVTFYLWHFRRARTNNDLAKKNPKVLVNIAVYAIRILPLFQINLVIFLTSFNNSFIGEIVQMLFSLISLSCNTHSRVHFYDVNFRVNL